MSYICVLDFEATCWENMTNKKHEIIEFPSVLLLWDKGTNEIKEISKTQIYCKPKNNSILSEFCKDLTKIKQKDVDDGISFPDALKKHEEWIEEHIPNYEKEDVTILTCGAWDLVHCAPDEFRNWEIWYPPAIYMKFINIKNDFEKLYGENAGGMMGMLKYLAMVKDGYREPVIKHSGFMPKKKYRKKKVETITTNL